jgi:hypothetical protein
MRRQKKTKPSKPRAPKRKSRRPEAPTQSGFLEQFRTLMGPEEIIAAGRSLGVIERQRKVDLPKLVEATVLSMWGTPGAPDQRVGKLSESHRDGAGPLVILRPIHRRVR